jgi:hypothetical protein
MRHTVAIDLEFVAKEKISIRESTKKLCEEGKVFVSKQYMVLVPGLDQSEKYFGMS